MECVHGFSQNVQGHLQSLRLALQLLWKEQWLLNAQKRIYFHAVS